MKSRRRVSASEFQCKRRNSIRLVSKRGRRPRRINGFPSGGFPVINYEPTGLTLKFTPLVYPNFDVQVKMSIESKDVAVRIP